MNPAIRTDPVCIAAVMTTAMTTMTTIMITTTIMTMTMFRSSI